MDMSSVLRLARLQAEKVPMDSRRSHKTVFRHGAVLFDGNRIINVGRNQAGKTHPRSNNPYASLHAETDSIIGVPRWRLHGASLLVVRLNMGGDFVLSRPCQYCEKLIIDSRIRHLYWTGDKQEIHYRKMW